MQPGDIASACGPHVRRQRKPRDCRQYARREEKAPAALGRGVIPPEEPGVIEPAGSITAVLCSRWFGCVAVPCQAQQGQGAQCPRALGAFFYLRGEIHAHCFEHQERYRASGFNLVTAAIVVELRATSNGLSRRWLAAACPVDTALLPSPLGREGEPSDDGWLPALNGDVFGILRCLYVTPSAHVYTICVDRSHACK